MERPVMVRSPEEYCDYLSGQVAALEMEVLELRKCSHGECIHAGDPHQADEVPVGALPLDVGDPVDEPEHHEEEPPAEAEEELTQAVETLTEAVEELTEEVHRDVEADEHLADEVEEEGVTGAQEVPVEDAPTHEASEPAPPTPRHGHPLRRR